MDKITTNGYIFIANTLKSRGYEVDENDLKNFFDNSGDVSITDASKELGKYVAQNNSGKELSKEDSAILDNVLAEIDKSEKEDKTLSATELSNSYTYETSKTSDTKATTDTTSTTSNTTLSATSGVTIPIDDKGTGTLELVYDSDGNPKVNVYTKSGELLTTRNVRPSEVEKFNAAGANIDTTSTPPSGKTTSAGTTTTATVPKSTGLASPKNHEEVPDNLTLDPKTFTYKDENGTEYVKSDWADIGNSDDLQEQKVDDGTVNLYQKGEDGTYTQVGFKHKNSDGTWSYYIKKDNLDSLKESSKLGAENKKPADAKLDEIDKLYQAANNEQGIFGKLVNGFKNLFYTQNSESRIQDEIAALRERIANGEEVSQEEIDALETKIETYRNNSDKQVTNIAGTGAAIAGAALGAKVGAAIGTLIPIPIVGTIMGGAVGAIIGGFLVGGATKVAVEQVENMTDKVKGNSWQNDEDLGKQFITGGATGGFAAVTAGIAGKIQGAFGKLFGLGKVAGSEATVVATNGAVNTGKTVLAHAVSKGAAGAVTGAGGAEVNYIAECIADEEQQFNLDDALAAAGTGAAIGGAIGTVSGAVSGVKNVNTYNKDINPTPQAQTTGNGSTANAAQTKNPFKRFGNWLKNKFGNNKKTADVDTQEPKTSESTGLQQTQSNARGTSTNSDGNTATGQQGSQSASNTGAQNARYASGFTDKQVEYYAKQYASNFKYLSDTYGSKFTREVMQNFKNTLTDDEIKVMEIIYQNGQTSTFEGFSEALKYCDINSIGNIMLKLEAILKQA